jgi:hypothetical protein
MIIMSDLSNVTLTHEVQSVFAALSCLNAPVYLNAFYAGLLTQPKQIQKTRSRLMFICNGVPENDLLAHGFIKEDNAVDAYTRLHQGKIITLHRVTPKHDWMFHYAAETQPYTCTSIFVDVDGRLHDASAPANSVSLGIMDATLGVLRTLRDPIHLLEHQPLTLFNTLDRMMRGYLPCKILDIAMSYWQPADEDTARDAINALYRRCLQWNNQARLKDYAGLLQRYTLIEKLLDLPTLDNIDAVVQRLINHLQLPSHSDYRRLVARTHHNAQTNQLRNPNS